MKIPYPIYHYHRPKCQPIRGKWLVWLIIATASFWPAAWVATWAILEIQKIIQ